MDNFFNAKNYALAFFSEGIFSKKFNVDIIWNTGSFVIMAVVGLLLNIIIAKKYGADTLGVFSQVYAIYLLLSQLSVSGIHLSILKITAQYVGESESVKESFSSALLLVVFTAGLTTTLIYLVKDVFDQILSSSGVSTGLMLALPGLFLFSLNKTFLALLNGLRHMKAYAVFQGLRSLLILTSLLVTISFHIAGPNIPVIFSVSEGLLFLLQLPLLVRWLSFRFSRSNIKWIKVHWDFGTKAMLGNLLLDVNSRVDVLLLGFLSSDILVGVYSFASMLADGFSQLLVVVRAIVNPIMTQALHENGKLALQSIMQRGKKITYLFFIPIGVFAILGYPILNLLGLDPAFNQSWLVFSILILGVLLCSGYMPFQMVFNQMGHPWHQTVFLTLFFFTNVMLNLIFIPIFGINGSAIATSLAFVLQVFYLKKLLLLWDDIKL